MAQWFGVTAIVLAGLVVWLALPLVSIAYYVVRLAARRDRMLAKIQLLGLEDEYLRIFHLEQWQELPDSEEEIVDSFEDLFRGHFSGENSLGKIAIYAALRDGAIVPTMVQGSILPFAVAGALLYSYPQFIQRYAASSLNPQALYMLTGRLWLSVVIGIVTGMVTGSLLAESMQPLAAFLGAYLPLAALDWLEKKVFGERIRRDDARARDLLEIVKGDAQIFSQLEYIGIRSVLQLAYDNPLRLFVETGLDLEVCTDLVDQANLHLFVPSKAEREGLNRYGVRSAVDLMTQVYAELPPKGQPDGRKGIRFLEPDEELPQHWREPLEGMANVMKLEGVASLRNTIQVLTDNAHVTYLHGLWERFDELVH
jgi:hypothetical protein